MALTSGRLAYSKHLCKVNIRCISLQGYKAKETSIKNSPTAGTSETWNRRVVTGLQPTGALHVGNYFAAVQRCVKLQQQGDDLMIFIADLHAHTTQQNPTQIQKNILELTAYLLASGIDPEQSILFAQSAVPRHAELCWLLACLATHARLAHLPQFKEKSATMKEVPIGLLLYPVLQAADVLVYRGTHVPVGTDQLQHLQVAAQLVRTFHHRYGRLFPTPSPILPDDGSDRLRSLRDPTKKMSKSDTDPKSRILLSDSDDVIRLKIRKAVTDFNPQVTFEPDSRPGVSNLVTLHCLAADKLPEEVVLEAEGLTTARYKQMVADALVAAIRPIRERANELLARPGLLRHVLRHGAARARRRADIVYGDVAERLGLANATLQTSDEFNISNQIVLLGSKSKKAVEHGA
ncbi:tryptophan--tRNA ligase, mitochondrial isoform X1 [Danaus plexippus]|uniref:tryptophan--tRNA ligase n=1 Tax=Danaus plexippus plexippus TaxID=278856 RepID=A0A212FLW9_DANPL|nr:tryptophan--tRNA ligase, mitochondrial isoform X1 [Danaus plexippus]OWR54732.1 Tryptophanyl-tRNA synthetase [Danaus plexippus plexippus]